jgi:hypothetical protein
MPCHPPGGGGGVGGGKPYDKTELLEVGSDGVWNRSLWQNPSQPKMHVPLLNTTYTELHI